MQSILTSDDLRETKSHGIPDFPFEYYLDDTREFYNNQIDWHWHNEFEIVLVLKGSAICHIDNHTITLNRSDAIFINSSILHQFTSENYAVMPNIVFAPSFIASTQSAIYQKYIAPIENSTLSYFIFKPEIRWQNQILELLGSLFCHVSKPGLHELLIRNIVSEIWLIFHENVRHDLIEREHSIGTDLSHSCVAVMLQYIQTHFSSEISLEDIAAIANVSKNTAIRYFNDRIGISPIDYLIKYRISTACRLLKETSDKVTHIAACVGYPNTSYFCKTFKRMVGLSPKEYRNSKYLPAKSSRRKFP